MASVFYECNTLHHRVFQPQTIPETRHPPPRSLQIELIINLDLVIILHDCIRDWFTESDRDPIFSQQTLRFDLDLLENHDHAYEVLAPTLTRAGINPESHIFYVVIDEIIEHGLKMGNGSSNNRGHKKVLPLRCELWGTVFEHGNEGLLEESAAEAESSYGYGMVPARQSSVKKMLKRVRVEGGDPSEMVGERSKKRRVKLNGEDCVICLEEIKVGLGASQMPCCHTFHSNCIKKWLKQSHYCPICRFVMPT